MPTRNVINRQEKQDNKIITHKYIQHITIFYTYMLLINNLLNITESSASLDAITPDMMNDIQKNLRDGAKDLNQHWANALELVHTAYEVAGVERPTPDMSNAWKQYEENLQYAVTQLAKTRGMDGDWRMSSSIFREAMEYRQHSFRVTEIGDTFGGGVTVNGVSLDAVIHKIKKSITNDFDITVNMSTDGDNPNMATLSFSKFGIRKNYKLRIQQL